MSSIVNKVKDALHHDKSHEQKEGTHGPHNSRVANAADPRVDSDRDHRANPASATGMNTHATSNTMAGHGPTHNTGLGSTGMGSTGTYGTGSTNAGPHNSNLMNKADPRVDSDRDHRAAPGGMTGSTGVGSTGLHSNTHSNAGFGSSGTYGTGSTNAGPHDSNLMNKADPRVDSDRDHRAAPGGMTGSTGVGSTGLHSNTHSNAGFGSSGTHGTHGTHTAGLGSTGPGPAPHTAGPHKSDMLNKVDPRVDSDLDGSKTVGQDKTYMRS